MLFEIQNTFLNIGTISKKSASFRGILSLLAMRPLGAARSFQNFPFYPYNSRGFVDGKFFHSRAAMNKYTYNNYNVRR